MKNKLKKYIFLAMVLTGLLVISSCSSFYSYDLVTYNETTAKVRGHEVLGSIELVVKAEASLFDDDSGFRKMLIDKAKEEYGNDVDDVVNIATSQTVVQSSQTTESFLLVSGDAIKYKEAAK